MYRFLLIFSVILCPEPVLANPTGESTFLIHNVIIIDGSGDARRPGAVRIRDGVISEAGLLIPQVGELLIDGQGKVLAPGFIDTHSHVASEIKTKREAFAAVSQGITTAIGGQDGSSPDSLQAYFDQFNENPGAINIAFYSGHNSLRERVMGNDFKRTANDGEVESMSELLEIDMKAGALGVATGLEYEPGIYSETSEVIALAKVAAQYNGRYMSHIRSEDRWFLEAVDEIIEIGRVAKLPVQISHFKLAMKSLWGRADEVIAKLDAARAEGVDITADLYPYEYWQSNIMVLVPSRDLNARSEFEFALAEITPPEGLWFTQFDPQPEYVGKKLSEIAQIRSLDPVTTLMQMAAESRAMENHDLQGADAIIGTSMTEEDILALIAWPHTNICTDGGLDDLHPRAIGTYPKILGRYVREKGALGLEEAIHKMTGLAAHHVGLKSRGLIKTGQAADLVLFDPDTILDRATPIEPKLASVGIMTVWVNGSMVFNDGTVTGNHPGQIIKRGE
ncbi:MAG: N-acyl-D-amino-acid deacylase [Rhodothermales bacterium]|jgi:N-acyl-D-amino-acid deacylase